MARTFFNEQIRVDIDQGSSVGISYSVINTQTASGDDYGQMLHPYPVARYDLGYNDRPWDDIRTDVIDIFNRAGGTFGGFRVHNYAEYSTNNYTGTPTATDQLCVQTTGDNYQITVWYGTQGGSGVPRRRIRKPVTGSALVSINGASVPTDYSVDYTTGIIAFTDNADVITGITQAASARVTVGSHTYQIGDLVHISGVSGMTQINGIRAAVTAFDGSTITLAINSTAFSAYSSGGATHTAPQPGEEVKAGCLFDIPMRFESDIGAATFSEWQTMSVNLSVVEILNP